MCVQWFSSASLMFQNMEKPMSKRLQKTCKELRVITLEAQQAVWRLAPRDWIGKRKSAIAGVARQLGWPFARTWNIAHGRARIIRAEEWLRLNEELSNLNKSAQQRQEYLNDISVLARSRVSQAGEDARPLGLDRGAASEVGLGGKRRAG